MWKFLRCHPKDITNVAFHRSYPLFASCSDDCTAYVFHGMVYSDLNQNPLIVPLEILRGHTSSNGRGKNFQHFLFFLSGGLSMKVKILKGTAIVIKKKWTATVWLIFLLFLFTGKSWRHIIKYSHYITHPPTHTHTHTSISMCISVLNPTLKPIIEKTWFETQMGPSIVLLTKFLCERLTSLSLSAPIMILLYNNLFT